MGYALSFFYEMELVPGQGVPLHAFPYAKFVYVVDGALQILRVGSDGKQEQIRCGRERTGDEICPTWLHQRLDKPARFLPTSTYYHEAILTVVGDLQNPRPR